MSETHTGQGQMTSKADLTRQEADPHKAKHLRWKLELENAEKVFENYHTRCDTIVKRYRDERDSGEGANQKASERRYNALWSMTETLKPLLYTELPVPYVGRWHDDGDGPARDAALMLQRALKVMMSSRANHDVMEESVGDYTLMGRGTSWITYVPEFGIRESELKERLGDEDEPPEDEYPEDDAEGETPRYEARTDAEGRYFQRRYEYKMRETCVLTCVSNKDILHAPATRWADVAWVARRVPMLREEAVKRFGKKLGEKIPLAMRETGNNRVGNSNTDDFKGQFARAEVWEIWDRVNRKVIWLCPQHTDEVLDEKADLLELDGFYPCAKPMFGTMTSDTMVPVPDYCQWQDIAMELDDVTLRISLLTSALRVVGVYSAEMGATLKQLVNGTRVNEMVEVQNWAMFAEKGGLKGAVDFFPIEMVMAVLEKLYDARGRLVAELYEITGISDIVRGASDPRETAAAQKLKGSFANARLSKRQKLVARHAEEILQIKAEIICSKYSDETIIRMASAEQIFKAPDGTFDVARFNAAMRILRDEPLRAFKVQITNETLAGDVIDAAKAEAESFLQGMSSIMASSTDLLTMAPKMGPVIGKMIMFAVRKFRVGRELEADFERSVMDALANVQPPPGEAPAAAPAGPTPEELALKGREVDIKSQELGIRRQELLLESRKLDIDERKVQGDHAIKGKAVGVQEFKAHADVAVKREQTQVQAQQAAAQTQQSEHDMAHRHQLERRGQMHTERQHEDGMIEREVDREDEADRFEKGRKDAAADRAAQNAV